MPVEHAKSRIGDHFESQALACARMGSPFTARLCRLLPQILDNDTATGRRVWNWQGNPRDAALALRLCGGLHALVLARADTALAACFPPRNVDDRIFSEALTGAITRHDERLCQSLDSAPQTNEIARAAMLLPGFLTIGRETSLPLAIREIGSSAGLNLLFDRFHHRYGAAAWGDPASPVKLAPEIRGENPPPLDGSLHIATRKGSDIAPINVAEPDERLRLKSYVWADQPARHERLDAALALAAETPFTLERADAADFVEAELAARATGSAFVLFHSIMWQYMPQATQHRIKRALAEAGNAGGAPVAWLRMEPMNTNDAHATLRLTLWPDGTTRDLAHCDFHGRWIEWLGD